MAIYYNFFGVAMPTGAIPQTYLTASADGQTLVGPDGGAGLIDNNLANVTLVGGNGDNSYSVGISGAFRDESTTVIQQAAEGTNTVSAWANYVLPANIEIGNVHSQFVMIGNSQNDLLTAEDAGGVLVAGSGTDVLVGSAFGSNTFVFGSNAGDDVVYGFITSGSSHDVVEIPGAGFTSFSQVKSNLTQVGSDVELTLSPTSAVIFRNTTVSQFQASDFLLQTPESALASVTPAFDDEFNSLSTYDPTSGLGTWKTNFWYHDQADYTSRTGDGDQIFVDPTYAGLGSSPLGIDPFSVNNGILSITADVTPSEDLSALNGYQYTSGLLTTETSYAQEYGYFEIKAKLPSGAGLWPAFWLLPTDHNAITEVDIMEQVGGDSVYQTSHSNVGGNAVVSEGFNYIPGLTDSFHTFGLLWTPTSLTWYLDGTATYSIATPADMHTPMYMLMSLAVGGDWAGAPTSASEFPAGLQIDYVHAYALSQLTGAAGVIAPGQIRAADDFSGDGKSNILVENTAGAVYVGETNASGQFAYAPIGGLGSEWSFRGTGDLLGDGNAGFLIENTNGAVDVGEVVNGQASYTPVAGLGPEWSFHGTGDFLGAGNDQFLIENTQGAVVVGEVENGHAAYTTVAGLGPEWKFVGTGDFLGDGLSDFLIENTSGAVVVGEVHNGKAVYTPVAGLGKEWTFVGAGDFLGDGISDFLIENTSGAVVVGEVHNGKAAYTAVGGLGSEWRFVGVGDYGGTGQDSFLIENTTGAVYTGTVVNGKAQYALVGALGSEWSFHG
jgi:beta-glucanase (GH16 family)